VILTGVLANGLLCESQSELTKEVYLLNIWREGIRIFLTWVPKFTVLLQFWVGC
jgi:hypothetical protein